VEPQTHQGQLDLLEVVKLVERAEQVLLVQAVAVVVDIAVAVAGAEIVMAVVPMAVAVAVDLLSTIFPISQLLQPQRQVAILEMDQLF
jgi:hypothetical protein